MHRHQINIADAIDMKYKDRLVKHRHQINIADATDMKKDRQMKHRHRLMMS